MPPEADTTSTDTESPETTQVADKAKAGTDKLFTQADLDRKIAERLSREKTAAAKAAEELAAEKVRQFREEHGFDDEALETWKQRDQAAAQARALKSAATKAENLVKSMETRQQRLLGMLQKTLCDNELVKELTAQKCRNLALAIPYLKPRIKVLEVGDEYKAVVVDEKGEPTDDTIADVVKQTLDQFKELKPPSGNWQGSGSRVSEGQTSGERTGTARNTPEGRKRSLAEALMEPPRTGSTLTSR